MPWYMQVRVLYIRQRGLLSASGGSKFALSTRHPVVAVLQPEVLGTWPASVGAASMAASIHAGAGSCRRLNDGSKLVANKQGMCVTWIEQESTKVLHICLSDGSNALS